VGEQTCCGGCSVFLLDDLSTTSDETSSSSGNKTNLLTSGNISSHSGWVTNMLMVTTTVRMLDWVHGDTSNSWPVLSLSLHLVPNSVGLEEWLVSSLTTGGNTDHSSAGSDNSLSGSGWESDSGLLEVIGVTNDDSRGTGGSGERSSVSLLTLTVGYDGTLWHGADWENVSNGKGGFLTSVDKLTGVHSLDGNEILNSLLVSVCISEDNLCKWGSSTCVVNDISNNTLDVSLSLDVIEGSESSWSNSMEAS